MRKAQLAIRIEPALLAELERIRQVETMSRSQCAAWLIRRGVARYRAEEQRARRATERAQALGAAK